MTTHDMAQRSEAWFNVRRGLPTCSRFDQILTAAQAKPSAAQDDLIDRLIAESILPPEQGFIRGPMTEEMQSGLILEAEARCAYEFQFAKGAVKEVGFVMHDSGLFGGSPDGLVGDDSGVEIKCVSGHTQVGYVRAGVLPREYKCQVHGYIIVTKRARWSFFSYCRNLPPLHLVVERDEFTDKLEAELHNFCRRYNAARKLFDLPPIGSAPPQPHS